MQIFVITPNVKNWKKTYLIISASSASSSVHIRTNVRWEIEVNNIRHVLEVDTSRYSRLFVFFSLRSLISFLEKYLSCEFKVSGWIVSIFQVYTFLLLACFVFGIAFSGCSKDFSSEAMMMSKIPWLNWLTAKHLTAAGSSELRTQARILNCSKYNFNLEVLFV